MFFEFATEIATHPSEEQRTDAGKDVWIEEPLLGVSGESKLVQPFLKGLKVELPFSPAILLDMCPKANVLYFTDTWFSMLVASLFTVARK